MIVPHCKVGRIASFSRLNVLFFHSEQAGKAGIKKLVMIMHVQP
jgi:hypothetical protein